MRLTNYCIEAGISIFFLVGCLVHLSENDIFSVKVIEKFKRLIYVLMFETMVDVVFAMLNGRGGIERIALYAIKAVELIINPMIAFLVFDIFYDRKANGQDKIMVGLRKAMITLLAVGIVLQTTSLGGGYVFYIDENNLYHRGNLVLLYVLVLVAIIVLLIWGIIRFSEKTQSVMGATLMTFAAILIGGIFLRGILSESNYDFLCMAVATLFLLMYYSHVTLRVDPLTQLLNRQVYQKMLERIDYTTIVIMIDANNFKQINDTFGHECGDWTLRQLARAICKAYGKYGYCFRLGGDEFCVVLRPGAFDKLIEEIPHRDAYSMAKKFLERLEETILAIQEENKEGEDCYLEYGVSQGYGIFYSKENYPSIKERKSIGQVIKLADKRMYDNKKLFKSKTQTQTQTQS